MTTNGELLAELQKLSRSRIERRKRLNLNNGDPSFSEIEALDRLAALPDIQEPAPIDMLLFCPSCGQQHIDAPEPGSDWTNPPHKSHLCHGCGAVWRPADVTTNGVSAIQSKGSRDNWPLAQFPRAAGAQESAR